MNIINGLEVDNQSTLMEALSLFSKSSPENSKRVDALRSQLMGEDSAPSIRIKEDVYDWRLSEDSAACELEDTDPFAIDIALNAKQLAITYSRKGTVVADIFIEINEGTPALHLGTSNSDSLVHLHYAQGGIVATLESPSVWFKPSDIDRHSYHEESYLIRYNRDENTLLEIAEEAFQGYGFKSGVVKETSPWVRHSELCCLRKFILKEGERTSLMTFYVLFDAKYEEAINDCYAIYNESGRTF